MLPSFIAPDDWGHLALLNRSWNRRVTRGPLVLERRWRVSIYTALAHRITFFSSDDNFKKRDFVWGKIRSLKFYQVATFIAQYEELKKFAFRFFSLPYAKIAQVPLFLYKVFHPAVIIMSSSLAPGAFWDSLKECIIRKSFALKPEWFHDLDALEKKIWVSYHLIRGFPLSNLTIDSSYFFAMKSFARKFRERPEIFETYMKGHWTQIRYVLHHYEKHGGYTHFPVPCEVWSKYNQCHPTDVSSEWEPDTELYLDGVGVYEDKIFI